MKKIINILFTVFAAVSVLSCGSDVEIPEEPDNHNQNQNPVPGPEEPSEEGFGGDVTFTATIESLSDGSQPTWKKGDVISVFDGSSTVKATNTADDGAVGSFPATIKKGTESVFALYPSNDGVQLNATGVLLDIPVEQSTASPVPSYRVAKSRSDLLYFRNLVAVLNISVAFDGVTSVVIKADDAVKIAGTFTVDYSGDSPVVAASSSQVEVKGDFQKGVVYPVVLAPAELTNCSITAYVEDKAVSEMDLSGQVLAPGTVLDITSMESANPVYKITHLWLWGGTGPEWEGTKIFDLFAKTDLFNNDDGRGVEALKDNYLVFNSDGTFCNWAGEDGRNWWHIYKGSMNKETGIDLDLKDYYELLPRSTANYSINPDSTVVFTLQDGSTKTATLVPAGDYKMAVPETNPEGKPIDPRIVTISSLALRFDINATRENWQKEIMYTDYWMIAGQPRQLFVELEKMPDGFTVPAASCTTDADYKFTPPVYEFDFTKLPGTWNVRGNGKSEPWGLWVNGGSGDLPAFVSPIDKAQWGTWNESVYKETDNTLTIALTVQEGTTINGTIDWEYGEDGECWDCKWNKDGAHFGEDLSKYYRPIPKGISNVTVNISTGAGKIVETDKDFTFVTPGSHTFTCGKPLVIPNGCFALAFHIMDPIPQIAEDLWTDVDRFVNAPLDYVIIFEKK